MEFYKHRCECGCDGLIPIFNHHRYNGIPRYIKNHHVRVPREVRFCECGCGESFTCKATDPKRFIFSHINVGRCQSEETRRKRSDSTRGRKHSKETLEKIRISKLGERNPAKRIEVAKKISLSKKGVKPDHKEFCSCVICKAERGEMSGNNSIWYGKKHRRESRNKMRDKWKNPEFVKKVLRNTRRKNNLETRFESFLGKYFPREWKYVGNWEFSINGRSPDFINQETNQIIEIFGDYWHSKKKTGIDEFIHEQERISFFEEEGWRTLVIWEKDFKRDQEKVLKRIRNFVGECCGCSK